MAALREHKRRHKSATTDLKRKRPDRERCEIVSHEGRHKSEKKKPKREKERKGVYSNILVSDWFIVCFSSEEASQEQLSL